MNDLSQSRAGAILEAIVGRRLLVLGDVMLDEYLVGDVHRISPEAPVPVVRVRRTELRLGGAGNVAANAAAVGSRPRLVGLIGADPAGQALAVEATARGVDPSALVSDSGRPTTVKTRVIAQSQQVVRYDREADEPLDPAGEQRVLAAFLSALAEADAVVVSDYGKGLCTPRVLQEALAAARAAGLRTVVDPTVPSFPHYQPVTCLTPNHHEAGRWAQVFGHDDQAVTLMARRIVERLDTEAVLITRGELGMTLYQRGGQEVHIPTVAREVYDVTGAGDTVTAVFTLALSAGASLLEAAILSNHAAGIVVGKVGTATASPAEILRSFD